MILRFIDLKSIAPRAYFYRFIKLSAFILYKVKIGNDISISRFLKL